MTTVTFFKSKDLLWGFESRGHTGYGVEGSDILCASVSAMSMFVVNAIETGFNIPIDCYEDSTEPLLSVKVPILLTSELQEQDRYAVNRLFYAYRRQLEDLAGDYPHNLRVVIADRDR